MAATTDTDAALPDLAALTVLVTGATGGIERDGAGRLGHAGARVLIHGRDRVASAEPVRVDPDWP